MTDWINSDEFEARVAHIARALWPGAAIGGSVIIGGRERDGVYVTEECVHAIEATALRTLEKARKDSEKLKDLAKQYKTKYPNHAVKLWFITKEEPTAEQRGECLKNAVTPASFAEFQSRLIDVRGLLQCRANYRFGSNDEIGPAGLGEKKYVDFGVSVSDRSRSYSALELAEEIRKGSKFTLLGDFGAGKSTVLAHIYKRLESIYLQGGDFRFPVFLNLRDHHGQDDPVELLERHSKKIGWPSAAHLVRAWRAGYCHLLIDGFDEISPLGASVKSTLLRNSRREALTAIRELIRDQPSGAGLIVSGRPQYFDSPEERRLSLGTVGLVDLVLNDFTDEQVRAYLSSCGLPGGVPRWFPKRPYLVATLARKSVSLNADLEMDPGFGWDMLLTSLCEREAGIAPTVEGRAVRGLLERLATMSRRSFDGLAPLAGSEFVQVFRDVCGFEPDARGLQLLARLSGLATTRPGEDSRTFVDEDFADACRAGDVARMCCSPWEISDRLRASVRAMGATGLAVLDVVVPEDLSENLLNQALEEATSAPKLDVFQLMARRGVLARANGRVGDISAESIEINGIRDYGGRLTIVDSYVDRVVLEVGSEKSFNIALSSTYVKEVVGPSGKLDLPAGLLDDDCEVVSWTGEFATNAQVFDTISDVRVAVLITVLRKLFLQSGSGRKEDALFRGLGPDAQRYVGPITAILQRAGIASSIKKRGVSLWIPDRSAQGRAERMVKAPNTSADPIVIEVKAL